MGCIFCQIRDGQISSTRVYADDKTLAFMDIIPVGYSGGIFWGHNTDFFSTGLGSLMPPWPWGFRRRSSRARPTP